MCTCICAHGHYKDGQFLFRGICLSVKNNIILHCVKMFCHAMVIMHRSRLCIPRSSQVEDDDRLLV